MLAGHMRNHTAVAAGGSFQQQVLSGCKCRQQQQVGHMIHNSVAHSSAERKEHTLAVRYNKEQLTDQKTKLLNNLFFLLKIHNY